MSNLERRKNYDETTQAEMDHTVWVIQCIINQSDVVTLLNSY